MAADPGADLRVARGCTVPAAELEWRFTTSGGPGGQHANKAATRAEVRFDAAASPSLSARHRRRILDRVGPVVVAAADDTRSQARNRELALDRLRSKLAEALREQRRRRPTRPSRASQRRRVETKKRRGQTKRLRGRVERDDG